MSESIPQFHPSGRGRRLAAITIDAVLLGILGAAIGFMFFDWACRLGPYGRVLGFLLLPLYFGVSSSSLTGGRSVGKALCRIRVGAVGGGTLPLHRGIARATILTWPYLLNGWSIPPMVEWPVVGLAAAVAVFGVGGSIVYLFLFNRTTGQSLHDLLVGTVVHRPSVPPLEAQPPLPTVHRVALGVLLALPLLLGGAAFLAQGWLQAQLGPHKELWSTLSRDPRFHVVSVRENAHHRAGATTTTVAVQVWVKDEPEDRQRLAAELARETLSHFGSKRPDRVSISLVRGYDLGISSANRVWSDSRTPEEWVQVQ